MQAHFESMIFISTLKENVFTYTKYGIHSIIIIEALFSRAEKIVIRNFSGFSFGITMLITKSITCSKVKIIVMEATVLAAKICRFFCCCSCEKWFMNNGCENENVYCSTNFAVAAAACSN